MSEERVKLLFGFALLLVLGSLASVVALGNVEQKSSHGLSEIIGGLLTLSGGFSGYIFGRTTDKKNGKQNGSNG